MSRRPRTTRWAASTRTSQGQVMTDDSSAAVEGLWAAGECGCVSVHGANRLGSNSLSHCIIWGRMTGEAAQNATPCAAGSAGASDVQDRSTRRAAPPGDAPFAGGRRRSLPAQEGALGHHGRLGERLPRHGRAWRRPGEAPGAAPAFRGDRRPRQERRVQHEPPGCAGDRQHDRARPDRRGRRPPAEGEPRLPRHGRVPQAG